MDADAREGEAVTERTRRVMIVTIRARTAVSG
jgi:hypothetical protein